MADGTTHAVQTERAARLSIVASGLIGLLKLGAGLLSGSLALLSEAAHALIDFGATIVTWVAVRESAKPADAEHTYGHGKMEAVAALGQTGLLLVVAAGVAYEAIHRLLAGASGEVQSIGIAMAVCVVSIVVDAFRWRHLKRVAAETRSSALAADALHFSSDLLGSAGVLAGLLAVRLGYADGDVYASLVVAAVIAIAGFRLGRETVDTLVDTAPAGAVNAIYEALAGIRGISEVNSVRVRSVGHANFAEVRILVPRLLALERVVSVKSEALAAIGKVLPATEVTLTADPCAIDDETVLERVLLIAAKKRIPVHHVTVQEVSGQLSVSLDLEVDGRMTLASAHHIATKLEAAIREELGPDTEVETHIEPLEAQGLTGRDADAATHRAIAETIERLQGTVMGIRDVHSVRVRQTDRGLVVSLHAHSDPNWSVEDVHAAIDELERAVKQACPDVLRIVSHAEPRTREDTRREADARPSSEAQINDNHGH